MDKQSQPEKVPECAEASRSPTPEYRATAFEPVPIPPALEGSRDTSHVHSSTLSTRDLSLTLYFDTPDRTETRSFEFGHSASRCFTLNEPPWVSADGNKEHVSQVAIITGDRALGFTCTYVPVVENTQCVLEIRQKSVDTPDARERASSDSREGSAREPSESVEEAVDVAFLPESSQPRQPDETPVELVSSAQVPSNLGYSNAAPSTSISLVSRAAPEGNSPKKVFECSSCRKTFREKYRLLQHERNHTGERPFPCFMCEKSFMTYNVLMGHVPTHTKNKPFMCTECDKRFTRKGSLKKHIQSFHS